MCGGDDIKREGKKMKGSNVAKGCALLLAFLAISVPLAAQESGLVLYAHGGGYTATQDVDAGGLADFDTGFTVGGGFGYAFSQRVALRADFTFGRSTANDGRPDGSGVVALDYRSCFFKYSIY